MRKGTTLCFPPPPFLQFCYQIQSAPDEQALRKVASDNCTILIESGLTMPLASVTLCDVDTMVQTIALHHVLLKAKAEMDQFMQGLNALGVLTAIKAHPNLFEAYFSIDVNSSLTAGIYVQFSIL